MRDMGDILKSKMPDWKFGTVIMEAIAMALSRTKERDIVVFFGLDVPLVLRPVAWRVGEYSQVGAVYGH